MCNFLVKISVWGFVSPLFLHWSLWTYPILLLSYLSCLKTRSTCLCYLAFFLPNSRVWSQTVREVLGCSDCLCHCHFVFFSRREFNVLSPPASNLILLSEMWPTYLSALTYTYVFCFRIKQHEEEEEKRKKNEEKDAEEIKRQNLLYEIEMKKKLSKKQEEINESRKLFFVSWRCHSGSVIQSDAWLRNKSPASCVPERPHARSDHVQYSSVRMWFHAGKKIRHIWNEFP